VFSPKFALDILSSQGSAFGSMGVKNGKATELTTCAGFVGFIALGLLGVSPRQCDIQLARIWCAHGLCTTLAEVK
jgi:hypothetical protein